MKNFEVELVTRANMGKDISETMVELEKELASLKEKFIEVHTHKESLVVAMKTCEKKNLFKLMA